MQTQCVPCGKVLANPSVAAKHVMKHPPTRRSARSAEWESAPYKDGQLWGDFASLPPRPTLANRAKMGGVSSGTSSATGIAPRKDSPRLTRSQAQERQRLLNLVWPRRTHPSMCAWCGINVTRETASVHHLTPRDAGGSDELRNLTLVHLRDCHDRLEEWTRQEGRAPSGNEWGQLDSLWGNILVRGVGTRGEKPHVVPGPSPLSTDDVPRYLKYLREIDRQYQEQIAKDPEWGMWVYRVEAIA